MSLSIVRTALADAIEENLENVSVHSFPPEIVVAPAIVIVPDDPYIEPETIGSNVRAKVNFRVTIFAGEIDNESVLERVETLAAAVYEALPSGLIVGECSRPAPFQVGDANLIAAEIRVAVRTEI